MPPQNTQQRNMAEKAAAELGFGGVDNARKTMGLDTLTTKPKDFSVVDAPQGTEGAALGGMLESMPDYTKQLTETAAAAQPKADQAFAGYLDGLLNTTGATEATAQAYKDEGVDDLTKRLNTYDQQLLMEQNALRRRKEVIEKNAVGRSAQAIADITSGMEADSLAKQADISIIRAGVAQDYATAKAIADRAVSVQMEREKIRNEALKANYDRNKDLFDKAEQRAFEAKQTDRVNAYNEELTKKQEISDVSIWALQQGADEQTMFAIRNAQNPAEAAKIAATYYAPILERQRAMEDERLAMEYERLNLERYRALKDTGSGTDGNLSGLAQGLINGTIDPDKLTPTQYGAAMDEIMAAGKTPFQQSDKQLQYQLDRADRVMETVDNALENVSGWTSGLGSLLSKVPATKARDFQKQLDTIKANIGFQELQAMRAASPTGGALGQVAVQELEYLQAVLGSLDAAQSPTQVRENLEAVKQHYVNWKNTVALSKASPPPVQKSFTPITDGVKNANTSNNDPLGLFK